MTGRMRMRVVIAAAIVCCALAGLCDLPGARAEEGEVVSTLGTSTSLSGLTGLLVIESAHTLPAWKAAVSVSGHYLRTSSPTVNLYQAAGIIALGLPWGIELAAVVPGGALKASGGNSSTGLSDVELSGKWRFVDQRESLWPAVALAVTGTLPTGDRNKGLGTVEDYGVAIKVVASSDVDFTPDQYAIGLYVEGGFFFQDLNQTTQEKNGIYAIGAAFPLLMRAESPLSSPLQFLLEVNGTYKRADDQDYVMVTPSLRYVGPVTVTAGFQYTMIQQAPDGIGGVLQVGLVF